MFALPMTKRQVVQVQQFPWGPNDWGTLELSDDLLRQILTLATGCKIRIPDVAGLPTFIINKEWRGFSMHRLREGGGKRGVRIRTLSNPSPALLTPSVNIDAGLSFSSGAPGLNPVQVQVGPRMQVTERPMRCAPRALSERRARLLPLQVGMKRKEISIVGVKPEPLSNPSVDDLARRGQSLLERFPGVHGWKFGAGGATDTRRFNSAHYDPRWFNTAMSLVLARDTVSNEKVVQLEQCLINLDFSVNQNASGLPCKYSASSPAHIYAVPLWEGLNIDDYRKTRACPAPPQAPPSRTGMRVQACV